ncbi:MAG: 2-oxoacid:acceptor oxidoreductase family protein [Spirochaetaceae bacterium]|nr:MAG: 2-oxoacid:acceptor oxidoreductase family protein [Spirochaetaceae bacterium]
MREEIIFAGFGGQGIILSGTIVCLAAMKEGKKVTHIPSYGAEMRGGTANCSVVISDKEIASPLVAHPSVCVVMNKPSLIKFEAKVKAEGILLYNSSLIDIEPSRGDIRCIPVPANEIAEQEGSARSANMVMLGLLAKLKPEVAALDSIQASLDEAVSARHRSLNEINKRCLDRGFALNGEAN